MSILGELIVKLSANTASFVDGMSASGKSLHKFGDSIESSLGSIGGIVGQALAPLGEMGSVIGETLSRVGELSGRAVADFGRMGGAFGTVAGLGAGAAAAILAIDAGAIGLAIHTAQSAAALGEMSQKAGVSTQTLAGLSVAGQKVGVDTETITKALGFLNANMVKAAIAPAGAKTAFSRLGVEVKDSGGKIRDTGEVLLDVIGKVNNLPAPEQGFIAKALLGKGGINLLPLIHEGVDEIRKSTEDAKRFGLGDPETIAAAQQFKATVTEIEHEFEGLALRLTKDLLPSLQFVAEKLATAFETGTAQKLIDKIGDLVKATLVFTYDLYQLGQLNVFGNMAAGLFELLGAVNEAGIRTRLFFLHFEPGNSEFVIAEQKRAAQALADNAAETAKNVNQSLGGITWDQYTKNIAQFKAGIEGKPKGKFGFDEFKDFMGFLKPKATADFDLSPSKEKGGGRNVLAEVKERIAALLDEAAAWGKVASASTGAESLIQEALKKGTQEFDKLKTAAAKDKSGSALREVLSKEDLIRTAGAEGVFDAAIHKTSDDLDKQTRQFEEQSSAAIVLGNAYNQGGAAIADAALDAKFTKDEAELSKFRQALAQLPPELSNNAAFVEGLSAHIAQLSTDLDRAKEAESKYLANSLTADLAKESEQFAVLAPYVDALNDSYLQSETAVRAARVELELYRWEQAQLAKGIVVSTEQKERERSILVDADRQAYEGSLKQEAARYDLNALYDQSVVKLQRVREVIQTSGSSTLLIDAAILNAQQQMLHQWDEAVLKVGNFGSRTKAVLNEIVLAGQDTGKKIGDAILNAYDGLTTNLAKLFTGQKANFKGVFQGLAESITKAQIEHGIGAVLSKFPGLGKIPGLGALLPHAKADGSANNPFYVRMAGNNGIPGIQGIGASAGLGGVFGRGGILGDLLGGGGSNGGDPLGLSSMLKKAGVKSVDWNNPEKFVKDFKDSLFSDLFGNDLGFGAPGLHRQSEMTANFGDLWAPTAMPGVTGQTGSRFSFGQGGLSGLFGGFMAGGGKMKPGSWYIAGERGPEPVMGPGSVMSNGEFASALRGRGSPTIHQTNVFNLSQPADFFKRSSPQIAGQIHRSSAIAFARGG